MQKIWQKIKIDNLCWILFGILILGAALRIYNIGKESLWYDEIASVDQAAKDLPVLFFKFHHSPFYFYLLKYWMRLFGMSEFSLRLPSAIFGIGAIFLIYKVGSILFNKNVGIISSLIIAISPFHLFYSQEAREYGPFLFLALLSIFFFLKMVKGESSPTNKLFLCYIITTVLLSYIHLWGIFVILAQNIFVFFRGIKHKRRWIISQVIIFLIFLIWFVPLIIYVIKEREYISATMGWIARPNLSSPANLFKTLSYGGVNYGGHDYQIDSAKIGFSVFLVYIFGFFSILGLFPSRKEESGSLFLLGLWLFIPISMLFILSYLLFPLFVGRYLISVLPAYCLLVAKGIDKIKHRLCQSGVVFLIIIYTIPSLHFYYKQDLKIRWNETFDYIQKDKKEDDIFVIVPARHITMFEYIGIKNNPSNRQVRLDIRKDLGVKLYRGEFVYRFRGHKIAGINDVEQLKRIIEKKIIKKGDFIWLIMSRWVEKPEEIKRYLESFCRQEKEKQLEGVSIFYYSMVAEMILTITLVKLDL